MADASAIVTILALMWRVFGHSLQGVGRWLALVVGLLMMLRALTG